MAGLLEEIANSDTISDDSAVSCPKCGCPIQWKPFLVDSIPWRCADCHPPAPGRPVTHHRWLESLPGHPTRWRASNEAVEPQDSFEYPPLDRWITDWLDLVERRKELDERWTSGDATCKCGRGPEGEVKQPSPLGWRVDCQCGRFLRFDEERVNHATQPNC